MDEVIRIAARAYELDRYLTALLQPRSVRDDLMTLLAFAGETARIASTVSDPLLGEIRLQWWRDALVAGGSGVDKTGHPIADGLVGVIARHNLPLALVEGMIDAEDGQVHRDVPEDGQALDAYLAKREGALFALAWRIQAGREAGLEPGFLVTAGQLYGRVRLLTELAVRVAEGRCPLPQADLHRHALQASDLRAGMVAPDAVVGVVSEVRSELVAEWQQIRSAWRGYSPEVKRVLLPLALIGAYLSAQEKLGRDCLRRVAEISPVGRVARLWLAHRLGRI